MTVAYEYAARAHCQPDVETLLPERRVRVARPRRGAQQLDLPACCEYAADDHGQTQRAEQRANASIIQAPRRAASARRGRRLQARCRGRRRHLGRHGRLGRHGPPVQMSPAMSLNL